MYGDLITEPDGSRWIRPRLGRRNGERLDDYARLDVRVSRDIHLRRGVCSLFLEVTNLLNRDNQARPESFDWWLDDRGVPSLSVDYESFLPVIVSLGVRWTM